MHAGHTGCLSRPVAALRGCAGFCCDSLQGAVLTSQLRRGLQYRHVVLPPDIAQVLPKARLLSEVRASTRSDSSLSAASAGSPHWLLPGRQTEWRAIGVQQSRGWVHYAIHRPEPHIMLFRWGPAMPAAAVYILPCSRRPIGPASGAGGPRTTSRTPAWQCRVPRRLRCCESARLRGTYQIAA